MLRVLVVEVVIGSSWVGLNGYCWAVWLLFEVRVLFVLLVWLCL